ncbi:uncharacterized protein LOC106641764 [Copidosoma floridanum]|uniref:uncharacterized protein LOC106641764 n=1 Tax=Copidosoma floridanum TaxID=29053 RepID=UPI0006C9DFF1|nr:uncharacterized protein LOC106641764 [Copidosoma floridanum]
MNEPKNSSKGKLKIKSIVKLESNMQILLPWMKKLPEKDKSFVLELPPNLENTNDRALASSTDDQWMYQFADNCEEEVNPLVPEKVMDDSCNIVSLDLHQDNEIREQNLDEPPWLESSLMGMDPGTEFSQTLTTNSKLPSETSKGTGNDS